MMQNLVQVYSGQRLWWLGLALLTVVVAIVVASSLVNIPLPMEPQYWTVSWETNSLTLFLGVLSFYLVKRFGGYTQAFGHTIRSAATQLSVLLGLIMVASAILGFLAVYQPLAPLMPLWLNEYIFTRPERVTLDFPWWIVVIDFLSVCIITPIWEEMLFRGVLFFVLARRFSFWPAAIVSSLLFGVLHADLLGASVFGIVLCYIVWKTQSLWPAIIVHATNNSVAVLLDHTFPEPLKAVEWVPLYIVLPVFLLSLVLMVFVARKIVQQVQFSCTDWVSGVGMRS